MKAGSDFRGIKFYELTLKTEHFARHTKVEPNCTHLIGKGGQEMEKEAGRTHL